MTPNPTPLGRSLRAPEELARHRHVYCSRYSGCLDLSIRRGWESFSCIRCPLFEQATHGQELERQATARQPHPIPP